MPLCVLLLSRFELHRFSNLFLFLYWCFLCRKRKKKKKKTKRDAHINNSAPRSSARHISSRDIAANSAALLLCASTAVVGFCRRRSIRPSLLTVSTNIDSCSRPLEERKVTIEHINIATRGRFSSFHCCTSTASLASVLLSSLLHSHSTVTITVTVTVSARIVFEHT